MAFPLTATGSLSPTFVPAPPVGVAVKLPSAFARSGWFPSILREPLSASDTLSEATAPVKLPVCHCPPAGLRRQVRSPVAEGWYPNIGSASAETAASLPPTYPVHHRHYAFRAGRNLPDKEFRYLRTVIVTAAVYWGLDSGLRFR